MVQADYDKFVKQVRADCYMYAPRADVHVAFCALLYVEPAAVVLEGVRGCLLPSRSLRLPVAPIVSCIIMRQCLDCCFQHRMLSLILIPPTVDSDGSSNAQPTSSCMFTHRMSFAITAQRHFDPSKATTRNARLTGDGEVRSDAATDNAQFSTVEGAECGAAVYTLDTAL